ncbi:MAG TPA: hydroxyacid dehydrogenase [Anaeromyxobacter sp.]|nr:hydroxyacid dehydrogenase [Anaeromyxobacter sp.]HVP62968.1 hydroxyacid dehydrogenase [Myxococcaceae bacterium]
MAQPSHHQEGRPAVLLPEPIEEEAVRLLESAGVELVRAPDPRPEAVAPLLGRADAVVLRTGLTLDARLLGAAERLRTVSRTGAGYDNVDVAAATRRGVIVTSSVGANTVTVVEHTLALLLTLAKRIVDLDRAVRRGEFKLRYAYLPRDLRGQVLGVVGFGRIGAEVARACHRLFAMPVLAHDALLPEPARRDLSSWVEFTGIEEVFRRADVVTLHLPLSATTRGLVGKKLLASMKPGALLLNTARGGVIDEAALVEALRSGPLGGAALDVFEREPPPTDSPLLALENAVLTPHAAALTRACVTRMAVLAAQRVLDVLDGYLPDDVANPEVLTTERWRHLVRGRPRAAEKVHPP